uniref:Uncharacterized protein MANES_06G100200 n=1 Tax=Rhizophora mucronata TaxID=61149 RepID=A0A2P2KUP4_RHIMU
MPVQMALIWQCNLQPEREQFSTWPSIVGNSLNQHQNNQFFVSETLNCSLASNNKADIG